MDNGSGIETIRRYASFPRRAAQNDPVTYSDQPVILDNWYLNRNQKRTRPVMLVPKNGSFSQYNYYRYVALKSCLFGSKNGSAPFREDSPVQGNGGGYNYLVSPFRNVNDFKGPIQNKIREEIMSGKAQLAVDLVELSKTRKMVTSAARDLLLAYRDLRAGRPFRTFFKEMKANGFRSTAGNKWLEYIYGWSPTYQSIFEVTDVLSKKFRAGSVVLGRVSMKAVDSYSNIKPDSRVVVSGDVVTRARGIYQYTIRDPKLFELSQLGFTNPLSIAWELLPWSFVIDWFIDIGGYINRMDYALGISDIWWQYTCRQTGSQFIDRLAHDTLPYTYNVPGRQLTIWRRHLRENPSGVVSNSFKGLKPFTNQNVRLTSALALLSQQQLRISRGF